MSESDRPSRHVTLPTSTNLTHVFDRMGYEFLDITETRAVVIFSGDILLFEVTTGRLDAAEGFNVEFWAPAPGEDRDPEQVVDTFVDEVTAHVDGDP